MSGLELNANEAEVENARAAWTRRRAFFRNRVEEKRA